MEQLARKAEKTQKQTQKLKVKTKVDVDKNSAKRLADSAGRAGDRAGSTFVSRFRAKLRGKFNPDFGSVIDATRKAGDRAGSSFTRSFRRRTRNLGKQGAFAGTSFVAGFIKAASFGQLGGGFSKSFISKSPVFGAIGATLGVVFAAKFITTAATAITAGLALALGAGLLAAPVVFLLKKQGEAVKQVGIEEKKVLGIKKQIAAAEAKNTRASGRKGDSKAAKQARQDRINDLKKSLAAEKAILREQEKQAGALLRLKTRAKGFLAFISKPVQIPLRKSLDAIGDGLVRLKKPFRDITAVLGPALVPFTKGVMAGLLNFVNALKPSLPGIVAGFKQWGIEIANIGGALGRALAGILSDPAKVVAAVKSISGTIQGLIGFLGILVSWLTSVDLAWSKWGSGFNVGTIAGKAAAVQTAITSMVIGIISAIQKVLPAVASMVSFMGRAFVGIIEAWNALPFTKNIDTGPIKDFTKAFETEVPKWIASLEGYKQAAKEARRKIKLRADAKDLESKIKAMKAKLKTVPKEKRTKLKAEIAAAEAKLRKLQGEINQLHGKQVDIWIRTHRATYYSVHGNKGHVPTNPKAGSGAPGSSGLSWGPANGGGMLDGAGMARTGGPTPINVEAPNINMRAYIDGREFDARMEATVRKANSRDTYRARVGRR